MQKPIILHTRPSHNHDQMIAAIEHAGFKCIHQPLFRYSYFTPTIESLESAILITSKAAIQAIPPNFTGTLYCVGPETASSLKESGFRNIIAPEKNIGLHALLPLIKKDAPKSISYLRGTHVKHNVTDTLTPLGITVIEHICYDTTETKPYIIPENIAAITFFSQRSYDLFIKNCPPTEHYKNIIALCYCDNFAKQDQILWKSVITGSTIQHLIDTFKREFLEK